jgi:hypothetical protein
MDPELIKALLFFGPLIALVVGVLVWVSRAERGALEAWEIFGRQRGMAVTRQGDGVELLGVEEGRELTLATKIEKVGNGSIYISSVECIYGFRAGLDLMKSRSGWGRLIGKITRRDAGELERLYESFYDEREIEDYHDMINDIVAEQGEELREVLMQHVPWSGDGAMRRSISAEQRAALVRLREALGGAWANVTVYVFDNYVRVEMTNMNHVMRPEKIEALWHAARPHVRRLIAVSRPEGRGDPSGW